ncbi:MAG: peptide deformylase, partial [Deltaproteobacteria bacterium]|nr:peptide deformylase [Deltaproteobacteria bacterium]
VAGLDGNGEPVQVKAGGILSRALQHEIDHLDGVLFIDRIPAAIPAATATSK